MRKITDFKKHGENPFHINGMDKRIIVKKGKTAVMATTDGEEVVFREPNEQQVVFHDEEKYVKLFVSSVGILSNLTLRGLTMLFMIAQEMVPRKNEVVITRAKASAFSSRISGASYYIAMSELLDYGIIARSESKKIFFVNPNIIFNGDRKAMIKCEDV